MSINEYYVYAGDYANPSHFEGNLIPDKVLILLLKRGVGLKVKMDFLTVMLK